LGRETRERPEGGKGRKGRSSEASADRLPDYSRTALIMASM
jgi:hypothetical protein